MKLMNAYGSEVRGAQSEKRKSKQLNDLEIKNIF